MKHINIEAMITELNNKMEFEKSKLRFKKKKDQTVIRIYYDINDIYVESVNCYTNLKFKNMLNEYFESIGLFIPEYNNTWTSFWWSLARLNKLDITLVWE